MKRERTPFQIVFPRVLSQRVLSRRVLCRQIWLFARLSLFFSLLSSCSETLSEVTVKIQLPAIPFHWTKMTLTSWKIEERGGQRVIPITATHFLATLPANEYSAIGVIPLIEGDQTEDLFRLKPACFIINPYRELKREGSEESKKMASWNHGVLCPLFRFIERRDSGLKDRIHWEMVEQKIRERVSQDPWLLDTERLLNDLTEEKLGSLSLKQRYANNEISIGFPSLGWWINENPFGEHFYQENRFKQGDIPLAEGEHRWINSETREVYLLFIHSEREFFSLVKEY